MKYFAWHRFQSSLPVLLLLAYAFTAPAAIAAQHCNILQYHHFATHTPRSTSVTPAEFEAHLDYLAGNGFQVLPLEEVVTRLRTGTALPDACVAITIDDAYISVYQEAFPRLRARGWPFTVFVNTEGVDQGLGAYMSWDQMREMSRAGATFENHSHAHIHYLRRGADETRSAWLERVASDIRTAQTRIGAELGRVPDLLAYPYGEFDDEVRRLVGRLGLTAFGQQSGPAWVGSDFLALPRFPMAAGYAAMDQFRTKVRSLPLPVEQALPENPLLPLDDWRPLLRLKLAPGAYAGDRLACYVSGQGRAEVQWQDSQAGLLSVRARKDLAVGRNRYNCTAPSTENDRFYWYSHSWVRRHRDGSWYAD